MIQALVRMYRICLVAFRRDRRDAFGGDMVQCFRDALEQKLRTSGRSGALLYAIRACGDVAKSGIGDRSWLREQAHQRRMREFRDGGESRKRYSIGALLAEISLAVRMVRRRWRFSLGVVLTLGLTVGFGVPVLGLADHYFLRAPTGVADPDRVMRLVLRGVGSRGPYYTDGLTGLDYAVLSQRARTLSGVAGWMDRQQSVGRGAEARMVRTTLATPSYFTVLGVKLALGRAYNDSEDIEGVAQAPCVVSYRFWKSTLGGTPDAIGRDLFIGDVHYIVTGVAAEGFSGLGLGDVDLWLPLHVAAPAFQGHYPELWTTDQSAWLRIAARLAPGATKEAAAAEAALLYRTSGERTRDPDLEGTLFWDPIQPGRTSLANRSASIALWLSAGGLMLLLLVLANLVNMSIARAAADVRQTAMRRALGARKLDLFAPQLVETLVLGATAALLGLVIAYPTVRAVRSLLLPGTTWSRPVLDARSAAIAFLIVTAVGSVIALWTTLTMSRVDPAELLRNGSGKQNPGTSHASVRHVLLVVQSMIFAILLCGATAFVTSLRRASAVDFGFDVDRVMSASIPLPADVPLARKRALYDEALRRLASRPEIASVSLGYMEPSMNNTFQELHIPGRSDEIPSSFFDYATPEYLNTFGVKMVRGRWFDATDRDGTAPVMVLNEAMARELWPAGDALGKCIRVGADSLPCRTIVGIVRNFFVTGRPDDPPSNVYYTAYDQSRAFRQVPHIFFRPRGDAAVASAAVRRVLQSLEPNLPAIEVHAVKENLAWMVAPLRMGAAAFTAFGILAATIAAIGLHSMASFVVTQQRRASAIKVAIGARTSAVTLPILGQSVAMVAAGLAVGFAAMVPLGRMFDPMLFHTRLLEPAIVLGIATIALAIGALAALSPILAARKMDIMGVLRD